MMDCFEIDFVKMIVLYKPSVIIHDDTGTP